MAVRQIFFNTLFHELYQQIKWNGPPFGREEGVLWLKLRLVSRIPLVVMS